MPDWPRTAGDSARLLNCPKELNCGLFGQRLNRVRPGKPPAWPL